MGLESCVLICSCVCMRFVLLTLRFQASPRQPLFSSVWVSCSLDFVGSILILELSECHLHITLLSPLLSSSSEKEPGTLSLSFNGAWRSSQMLYQIPDKPSTKSIKMELHPRGFILWLPVLFLHPVIEPACFSDTVTQLALCYKQCFYSFPK